MNEPVAKKAPAKKAAAKKVAPPVPEPTPPAVVAHKPQPEPSSRVPATRRGVR